MTTTMTRSPGLAADRSPAATTSRSRGRVVPAALALAASVLVGASGTVVWQQVLTPEPFQVDVGTAVEVDGLDLTVADFGRRVDAAAGVNAVQQPMSGPAMPMAAGAPGSAGSDGTGAAAGMSGMTGMAGGAGAAGSAGTAGMPGMAGMLEAGQERVDVAVVVANHDDEARVLDPDLFVLYSEGRRVALLAETVTTLTRMPLAEGSQIAGNLAFVVPQGLAPLQLGYADEPARVTLQPAPDAGAPDAGAPAGGAATVEHGASHDGAP